MSTLKPKLFFPIAQTHAPQQKAATAISATVLSKSPAAALTQNLGSCAGRRREDESSDSDQPDDSVIHSQPRPH
jgi:hypothetical protein